MLGTGSHLPNYWQNVLNAIFQILVGTVPTALEMTLLHILRNRTINKDPWEKRAAFPVCQVQYSFVIEVSCSAVGKVGITCSFSSVLKQSQILASNESTELSTEMKFLSRMPH